MIILGLDLSLSSTGYNIINYDEEILEHGVINTNAKENTEFERMYIIAKKCKELILKYNVDYVIAENSFFGGNANTGIKLARLLGCVAYVVIEEEKELDLIAPTSARKILLGDGKSKKSDVAQWIRENYIDLGIYCDKSVKSKGLEKNSDEYDSLCVSLAWLKQYKLKEKYKNKRTK